jgi:hypothetical protein
MEGQNVDVVKLEISKVNQYFLIKVTMLWILGVQAKGGFKIKPPTSTWSSIFCLRPSRQNL